MADPTGIGPYLLAFSDDALLPQSRAFTVAPGSGLTTQDFGPSNNFAINTIGALNAINNLSATGYLVSTGDVAPYFVARQITSTDNSLTILHPTGLNGNTDLSVTTGATVQKINYFYNTTTEVGTGSNLNLIAGDGVDITSGFDSETGFANYTFTSTGGGGGGGGVSSVGLTSTGNTIHVTTSTANPITSTGIFNVDIKTQNSPTINYVLAATQVTPSLQLSWVAQGGGGGGLTSVGVSSSDLTVGNSPLTSNGTITLALNTVPTTKGGTGQSSYTAGNMLYWASGTSLTKLTIGAANSVLYSTGSAPAWTTTAPTLVNQVLTYNGTNLIWHVPEGTGLTNVGITSGSGLLVAGVAATANGNRTVDFPTPYVVGNILRGSGTGYAPLAIGANNYVLTSDGTTFNWAPLPPAEGNAGQAVLNSSGVFQVLNSDITTASVIVASPLQTISSTGPAAGPITVTIQAGVGFTLSGDGALDSGKGVGYTIDGGGGAGSGVTTILGNNGITVTNGTGPTATISLPTPTAGNLLVGNGSAYAPLAIGAANKVLFSNGTTAAWTTTAPTATNDVLTYNGTTLVWAQPAGGSGTVTSVGLTSTGGTVTISGTASPITTSGTFNIEVPNWSGVPANQSVNMNSFGLNSTAFLALGDNASIPIAPTTGGIIGINLGVLILKSSTITGVRNIVTASPTGYAANGSILYGNGAGIYTSLAPTTNGYVLTLASGVPSWAPASGGGTTVIFGKAQLNTSAVYTINDSAVTADAIIVISGVSATTGQAAGGPFDIVINAGTSIVITSERSAGIGNDQNKFITYSYTR